MSDESLFCFAAASLKSFSSFASFSSMALSSACAVLSFSMVIAREASRLLGTRR